MKTESEPGTAAALLAAGRVLFAERGYEGASVRAITAHACANLGAITYHFGSKRDLYDQVVEGCVLPLVERVEAIALSGAAGRTPGGGTALRRIEEVVRAFYEHLRSHPELPRLMMQELALAQAPPAAVIGPIRRIHKALVMLVHEGQAAGEIRRDDPLVLVVSVIAQPIHFGLVGRAFATITGQDPDDPVYWDEVVRNAVTFVRAGLAAPSAEVEG